MKAVRLHTYHQQPVIEDVPEPKATEPFDVVVRIGGAGVCRTDLHIIEEQWAAKSSVTLPYTIGHENAGWVEEVGYVDKAIFQPTNLRQWYRTGFNTTEVDGAMAERHPGRFLVNTNWDPREGDEGLKGLEERVKRYDAKGVKLYTAEWRGDSRGWSLKDPEAARYLEKCQELGVKNVHVHKGPTIWPLDKDAFDVSDVDHVATNFPDLNFIVEHVGLPRIEDFCFMATQEPNVYAGLSVVIGGLMHARPNFFAKVMGELMFWLGEDRMIFGADYAIWEPKWQVEGFVDWQMPSTPEFSDYSQFSVTAKKKILGLNAARLYDIEVPAECQVHTEPVEPVGVEAS
jgi:predicted TIM-barrel fold metal-dependent hydrolase